MGALVTGDALRRFNLPRLTGYLLFGVIVGPSLGNLITESMAAQLQVVTGIATTLIALIAGLTLSVERLGSRFAAIVRLTAATLVAAVAGLSAVAWLAWPWLPIAPEAVGFQRLVMLALLVVMVVSFSPTMTAAVMADSGARGRLSDTVLAMVVLADLVILVLFSVSMQLARVVFGTGAGGGAEVLARLAWEIGGAVAFGVLIGVLFALYLRYIGREITLVLLAVCAVLSQVGSTQQLQPLLAALAAGVVIENLAVAQGDTLRAAVRRGAPPVLVVFFVGGRRLAASGCGGRHRRHRASRCPPSGSGSSGWACEAGVRLSGVPNSIGTYAWTGLVSQAGITLGFASVVATEFPGLGQSAAAAARRLDRHQRTGRPDPVSPRAGQAGELEVARAPARWWSCRTASRTCTARTRRAGSQVKPATGGVAVALDALMRERGGVWIAHGAGPADRLVVDAADKVRVPPESPSYVLRRLWLEEPTFSAYYGGFANEGLWPLCHVVDVRPKFRTEDWEAYQDINARFAAAIHAELGESDAPVFIQDYHLALVAPALRALRPDIAHRAVLAHPVALSGPAADLPLAPRAGRGAAGERPDRLPAGARPPELPDGRGRGAGCRGRDGVVARAVRRAFHARSSRCRLASTTIASRASPPIRRSCRNSGACGSCLDLRRRTSSGWASTVSTTPRASPSGSMPRCAHDARAPNCAAG